MNPSHRPLLAWARVARAVSAAGVVLAFAVPARADGPRPVTASEAASPVCFGMVEGDGAVYAVRVKSSCDTAANKCEVASYLTRVGKNGKGTTVGYLTLAKKDGAMPDLAAVVATAKPASLEKANAAMADATMPCNTAKVGDTLQLAGGRSVKVVRGDKGELRLRSDNFLEVVIGEPHEQLFWGPSAKTWYLRRAVATTTGQDTELVPWDVARLFEAPPPAASAQATALTHANALTPQCLGVERASGTYWFATPQVNADHVLFRMTEVGPGGARYYDVARKARPAMAPDPKIAAMGLTAAELAFANQRLAKVDAACTLAIPPLVGHMPLVLAAGADGETVQVSTVETPKGKMLRFVGKLGARRHIPADKPLMLVSAKGTQHLVVQRLGASTTFEAVALGPLALEPQRFPVPTALPACYKVPEPRVLALERSASKAALVLRPVDMTFGVEATTIVEGPADATAEALIGSITPELQVELAERLPISKEGCEVLPLPEGGAFQVSVYAVPRALEPAVVEGKVEVRLVEDGGRWELRAGKGRKVLAASSAPRWLVRLPEGITHVGAEGAAGVPAFQAVAGLWAELPDPPEVAMKAPKLLVTRTPSRMPHDKRCLAWDSAQKVAWIVRYQSACPESEFNECGDVALLTEVKKDGYYQRVTLAKDGSDWAHMFDHANTFLGKSDLGCLAGLSGTIKGRAVVVSERDGQVVVTVDGKDKRVGKLADEDGDLASVRTAFWHPEVEALVVELDAGPETRYLWVDLSKIK